VLGSGSFGKVFLS
jgi:calcium-dependent protein kinase